MTYRDVYTRDHPNAPLRKDGDPYGCPPDRLFNRSCPQPNIDCHACWNRKINEMSDDGQRLTAVLILTGILGLIAAAVYLIWG